MMRRHTAQRCALVHEMTMTAAATAAAAATACGQAQAIFAGAGGDGAAGDEMLARCCAAVRQPTGAIDAAMQGILRHRVQIGHR